jgi:Ca2+-binding RTX toxin-like protein
LSKTIRRLIKPRTLLLTTAILAVFASTAVAATITGPATGNWTLIGTTGNDTISGSNGNYTILGLGGNDTISVSGNGNNFVEADGKCPAGDQDTITASPGNSVYCSLDQITSSHSDTISVPGSGNNIILGGGYSNTISAGNGANAIYGGGVNSNTISAGNGPNAIVGGSGPNTISVGNANVDCGGSGQAPCEDAVFGGSGPDTISVGSGISVVVDQNNQVNHITCAKSNNATVYTNTKSIVKGCKTVYTSDPSAEPTAPTTGTPVTAALKAMVRHSKQHPTKAKKHSTKAKKHSTKAKKHSSKAKKHASKRQ